MNARLGSRGERLAALVTAAAVAGLLTGCGSAGNGGSSGASSTVGTESSAAPTSLAVSPAHPTNRSPIGFTFTAPTATGIHGASRISYTLSVTGPAGAGCVGVHEAAAPSATRGQRVSVTVGPAQLGAPWCAGGYTARAIELQRAACKGSAPCPQYIRVVGIVARVGFTITAS